MLHLITSQTQGLIFDCDGTLADTMSLHLRAWQETLGQIAQGWEPSFWEPYNGMPSVQIIQEINNRFGLDLDPLQVGEAKENRAFELLLEVKPIAPVVAVAQKYRSKLPLAVVSGGTRRNVERTLEALGILDWFDLIVTANNHLPPKPAPDMFLHVAKFFELDPCHCLVFEDGEPGLIGACLAGMKTVDVRPHIS